MSPITHIARASTLALLLMAFVGGCVHLEEDLVLNGNGSGSLSLRWTFPARRIAEIQSTAAAGSAFAGLPFDPASTSWSNELTQLDVGYAKDAPEGLRLTDPSITESNGVQCIAWTIRFDHIERLSEDELVRSLGIRLFQNGPGQWKLYQAPLVSARGSPPPSLHSASGMTADVRFRVPGPVGKTNAGEQQENTARWIIGTFNPRSSDAASLQQPLEVSFQHDTLTIPEHDRARRE